MKIPEGEHVCCAADMFEYDETKKLNLRQFLTRYKDQFPMLIVIIGGHYGETKFDCYDNFQVLRIHCYTAQPRVIAEDSRLNPRYRKGYITIPVDTSINYRVIKGHTKLGNPQPLGELLEQNDRLPLLVQMACDPQYPIRVGNNRHMARDFGHIMIKEKYMEHFYMMNAIDGVDLNMNKLICMACLCEDLEATPVTGFKYGSKEEFDEFCRKLSKDVAESGEVYDRSKGNEDYSEYSFDEMRYLLQISDSSSGLLTDDIEAEVSDSESDDYEEVPPELPSRNPLPPRRSRGKKKVIISPESNKQTPKSPNSPKSPKSHHKDSKGPFGFLKKKNRHEIENKREKETKQSNDDFIPPTSIPKSDKPKETNLHDTITAAANDRPHVKIAHAPIPAIRPLPSTQGDIKAEYVTLASQRTYINTQVGRATVKPMPKTTNVIQEQTYLPMDKGEIYEDEEYETFADIPKMETKLSSPFTANSKVSPLVSELQHKITQKSNQIPEAEEDEDDNYEVVGDPDNEGYMIPQQLTHQSPITSQGHNKNGPKDSKAGHTYANEFDVTSLSMSEVSESLNELGLDKYAKEFKENKIDGEILASLSVEDFTKELGMKKLEAIRLHKFAKSGHIPK
ncbi:uncharacterized protein LOC132728110 isoform X1 [Ruditapes philippinarum]|uniref:uncharacterized protein LOC132728110 isoform X1 n=1 Tax=Ruditapes philippinarum TaxID=129788 RepID=UPI00295B5537|nr:uncharacterized protein LOC132728110 isoform X1 [Ruditapes philippinarum]